MLKKRFALNDDIKALGAVFRDHGYSLYLVGGAVRDRLLGIENDDSDFTSDARPEEVMELFPHHVIPTGLQHGTVTVRFRRQSYEVTTFRSEGSYSDSRHPDSVTFARSLESDLKRRDFTINAFAVDCMDGSLIDLHGGREDLKRRLIRAIGDPEERFGEDALRMLRACRFASKLDFDIEARTFDAIKKHASAITKVSQERIREELFKTLASAHPAKGIELMRQSGLLAHILPELDVCLGVEQKGFHQADVYYHQLAALEVAASHGYPLSVRIAALLHDIAKPMCREAVEDGYTFHGHETHGADMVFIIMERLKCSNAERDKVTLLVREHMFNYTDEWSDAAIRRFIARVGKDNLEDLFRLRIADACAITERPNLGLLWTLEERVKAIMEAKDPISLKDLAIDGNDLAAIGIPRSPAMGRILKTLLDEVIENPALNERDALIARVKALL